jgi:hypothetical protein
MRALIRLIFRNISLAAAAVMLVTACVSNPTVDSSDEAQMTFDGLYPIKGGSADLAWARPGADISQYSKLMLQGVGIEYRPGGESGKLYNRRSSADYFEISDEQKERFEKLLRESFVAELGKSERFTIVNEPGPDVLLIRGGLLDVVSFVPPEPVGRVDIYLSRVGEATLILEIRDSVSEAILARAVDRRAAEDSFGMGESNRVLNTAEVRRTINAWARLLRERLDTYGAPRG